MKLKLLLFSSLTLALFVGCTTPSLQMPANLFSKSNTLVTSEGGLIFSNGLKYTHTFVFEQPIEKGTLIQCTFDSPNAQLAPLSIENQMQTTTKTVQVISPKITGVYKTNQDYFVNLQIFKDGKVLSEYKEKMILKMKE